MSNNNIKTFCILLLFVILSAITAAQKYEYIPNVVPHTRYNTQLDICFYYYGYGSCNVTMPQCSGVDRGQDKWINLGDACNRNVPPIIQYTSPANGREGQKLTLDVYCMDDDPVNLTLTGWTTQKAQVLNYDSAGTHDVHVTCTDSFGKTAEGDIRVTVTNTNRAPLFKSIDVE